MEEEKKEKCSRKLDFSAPLLSTRRPIEKSLSSSNNIPPQLSLDIFNRVPFSWEQSPGKPKEMVTNIIEIVPPPKLPPCMWHTRKELATSTTISYDEVCDGDIDNDDHDNYEDDARNIIDNHDVFSDALDVFSLGESIDDMIETDYRESNTSTNKEVVEEPYYYKPSVPNFIIQRFLQDAKELAISTALENSRKKLLEDEQNGRPCNFSPKAASCGFDMFIPWKIKHKPCCVKNSVVAASPRMRPQWSNRDKHAPDADPKF
ncbi:uncharacterized protein LOC132630632 [Lycium barbarum]|uniref:uncharacterized protein LOC132630632 n=1 Tax=Lycium barbarum TaxID=112863 RepID=UPI00293E17B1|nr:uncharacterized protein LOC132630632 [Lycium barbarum]